MKTAQWKTGFQALKTEGPELLVVTVLPHTPAAAAGIIASDIITEINGLPAGSIGQAEFGVLTKSSDGTVIHLKVVRDDPQRADSLKTHRAARGPPFFNQTADGPSLSKVIGCDFYATGSPKSVPDPR